MRAAVLASALAGGAALVVALGAPSTSRGAPPAAEPPSSATSPAAGDLATITAGMGGDEPRPIKRARRREGPPTSQLRRDGCMSKPEQCKCASKDPHKIAVCQPMIGYFCPESTLNLMASMCVELFGGVTACRCANQGELQHHVDSEAKKSSKKSKKSKKKSSSKKSK